jgi:beta-glucanase (GH16 family)
MKQVQTRRSLKRTRQRRRYLVSASLTAFVLAAGGTAIVPHPGAEPTSPPPAETIAQDNVDTVAYGKRSMHPASVATKRGKERPAATPKPAAPEITRPTTPATTDAGTPSSPPSTSTATIAPLAEGAFQGTPETEDWAGNGTSLYAKFARGGSSVTSGVSDSAARDGKALNLTIPTGAGDSPGNAAEVATNKKFLYGSFGSRVRTADCSGQPNTGAVTGIFTYGNDGTDQDGDGLTDNSEIDVEVLCARPDVVNLTIYTDYQASNSKSQRVSRIIDLKAGKVISTCYYTDFSGNCIEVLSGIQNVPTTVPAIPGFNSSTSYNDYKIDWTKDRVLFTVTDSSGKKITLWDYQGPTERIPHRSASYLVNFWHTSDWAAHERPGSVRTPTSPLTVSVDSSTTTTLN